MIPISRKNTFTEHSNKLRPKVKTANRSTHGIISSRLKLYMIPNHFMIITKIIRESRRLNNSLNISESGKKIAGILNDFSKPADPTIFPTVWLVILEKKNHNNSPDVA